MSKTDRFLYVCSLEKCWGWQWSHKEKKSLRHKGKTLIKDNSVLPEQLGHILILCSTYSMQTYSLTLKLQKNLNLSVVYGSFSGFKYRDFVFLRISANNQLTLFYSSLSFYTIKLITLFFLLALPTTSLQPTDLKLWWCLRLLTEVYQI